MPGLGDAISRGFAEANNGFDINRTVNNVFGVNPATDLKGIPRWSNEGEYGDPGLKSPKTMQQIKNNLLSPALTSHYGVEIGVPPALMGMLPNAGGQQAQLNLMCTEATLPGSNLATMQINNNFTGVTERHAYRRVFDDRINLTFYVDSENYLPIRFFEAWQSYIMNENQNDALDPNYSYRTRYPDGDEGYVSQQGLTVKKFERDYRNELIYKFVKSYPISITSMPVSYDTSSLLKCTVAMTYLRYVVVQTPDFAATASSNSIESSSNVSGSIGAVKNLLNNTDGNGNYVSKTKSNTSQQIENYTRKKDPYYNSPSTGSIKEMGKYTNY